MKQVKSYAFGKTVAMSYAAANQRVREELAKEGFGILTEIDVRAAFKEKLGRDFRNYIILGACNPAMAFRAFEKEIDIGTLLPCNVTVYTGDDGSTRVMIMDPSAVLPMVGNEGMRDIAMEVRSKMEKVLDALE